MINGLLEGWDVVLGYNDGAATGTVMGNNLADPNNEKYTLKFTATTVIPAPPNAPLATLPGYKTDTSNPVIDLDGYKYDWVIAKWGQDAEVYYIGDLTGEIQLNLINFPSQAHGLSHYTLFNRTAVPDGGTTAALLGVGLVGLGFLARRKV